MKILLVTGSINQGGAEYQLLALASLLQKKCHNVQVLALTDYSYYLSYIKENSLKYSFINSKGSKIARLYRAVTSITRTEPDLVISYIRLTSLVAMAAKFLSFRRFKLIISERTSLILPKYDLLYFNLALIADKITVNSITKLNYINKHFPLLKKRTEFIPNIIDLGKFSSVRRAESLDGTTRLTYVGRISPEKNLLNLIRAIGIINSRGFTVNLSLIGEAHNKVYLEELNQLIEVLSLYAIVKYEGPTRDIISVYEKTDLLCLVSFYEGFSNVLAEALVSGIPVIASDILENRYLIENERNGFLVSPHSTIEIANGLEQFLNLSQRGKLEISENNRSKSNRIFDQDDIYNKYVKLFS